MIPIDSNTAGFVVARAAHFGACLLLPGVFIFDRFVMTGIGGATNLWQQQWQRISRVLILLALPVALISGAAWLVFVSMNMSDVSFAEASRLRVLQNVLNHSSFGGLWKLRSIFWLATFITATSTFIIRPTSSLRSLVTWIALLCSVALAVSVSRAGHGADGTKWHQAADAAHLLIGAAWPIGLVPLAMLLFAIRRPAGLDKWISLLPVIQRFSAMSLTSVLLLAVSGVVNSLSPVGSWSNLVSTRYGQTLLFKAGCFAIMILLGAVNTFYLRPRLALDYQSSTEPYRDATLRRLQTNVWIEIGLGVAVLLAAGLLGTLAPACENCCCS